MCAFIRAYARLYSYTHELMHISVCIHACIWASVFMQAHARMCFACICVCVCGSMRRACIHVCMRVCVYACIDPWGEGSAWTRVHVRPHVRMCLGVNAHLCICIYAARMIGCVDARIRRRCAAAGGKRGCISARSTMNACVRLRAHPRIHG